MIEIKTLTKNSARLQPTLTASPLRFPQAVFSVWWVPTARKIHAAHPGRGVPSRRRERVL